MLDQNTDRMWYVIGAVVIGAAIILILNSTASAMFSSVANTFEDKTNEVTGMLDNGTLDSTLSNSDYWEPGTISVKGEKLGVDQFRNYEDIRIRYKERIPVDADQLQFALNDDYQLTVGQYINGKFVRRDVWLEGGSVITYDLQDNVNSISITVRNKGDVDSPINVSAVSDIRLTIEEITL